MSTLAKQARSGILLENLQEILDAEAHPKWALQMGQNQYFTPKEYAEFCKQFLRDFGRGYRATGIDPQVGDGNLVYFGQPASLRMGIELDNRESTGAHGHQRITGNCVKAWEIMDDVFPEMRFTYGVANPPFGKWWKIDGKVVDSTKATWEWLLRRCRCGYMIANANTVDRLKLFDDPRAYLINYCSSLWDNCDVKLATIYFDNGESFVPSDPYELHYNWWPQIARIVQEEAGTIPPFNIYLGPKGKLKTYLSIRDGMKFNLDESEIVKLHQLKDCHPLTLVTERETRKLIQRVVDEGIYKIEPAAAKAIKDALAEFNKLACPITDPTDFEHVAYLDEEDFVECVAASDALRVTPGKKYEISTSSEEFVQTYTRKKICYSERDNETYTEEHDCILHGIDRYIQLNDDNGHPRRFMDRPRPNSGWQLPESILWQVFKKPHVRTIADQFPDQIAKNLKALDLIEMMSGFSYYKGQRDYLARIGVKDRALIAADTGTGKSLFAISIIAMKGPKRALIIAPQGTIRSSEDEDDEVEIDQAASQWLNEIKTFGKHLKVYRLFNMDDYESIKSRHGGVLPSGVYVSYYEAMFHNKAMEQTPAGWIDDDLRNAIQGLVSDLPEHPSGEKNGWCKSVGKEKNGIRCILTPCMATMIVNEFDMILLDEAHKAQSLSSIVSQMILRMQPKYRYALTATPIPNTISNLFPLMGWLCVDGWYRGDTRNAAWPYAREEIDRFNKTFLSYERDVTEERKRKAADPGWKGKCEKISPIISSPARLLKLLKPTMAFISKDQCNPDMVDCNVVDVRVPIGVEQASLYGHFLNRGNIRCNNALQRARKQVAYLRSICADPEGFPIDERGGPRVTSNFNPKTIAILELTRKILDEGEQTVIVCSRKGQTATLERYLNDAGVRTSRIDSTVPAARHQHEANMFKAGKTDVMLMGIKCAVSHSFPECPNLIIGSLEYTYGSKHQAEGRVYRVNSKNPVTIFCVLHKNTIEETMFDIVATKEDSSTICLRGRRVPKDYKPMNMDEILADTVEKFHLAERKTESECSLEWPSLRKEIAAALERKRSGNRVEQEEKDAAMEEAVA